MLPDFDKYLVNSTYFIERKKALVFDKKIEFKYFILIFQLIFNSILLLKVDSHIISKVIILTVSQSYDMKGQILSGSASFLLFIFVFFLKIENNQKNHKSLHSFQIQIAVNILWESVYQNLSSSFKLRKFA